MTEAFEANFDFNNGSRSRFVSVNFFSPPKNASLKDCSSCFLKDGGRVILLRLPQTVDHSLPSDRQVKKH